MSRFDEMQSNHPQANTPWAGQTKAYETRSGGEPTTGWPRWGRITIDRGAPFIGWMLIYLAVGAWILLAAVKIVDWSYFVIPVMVFVYIPYSFLASSWTRRLWRTRWAESGSSGAVPELILGGIGGAAMIAALLLHDGRLPWLSVLLFGIQLAVFVVLIPVTLRRYPGFA